jgi:DivIVA domain-containing protein
MGFGQDPWSIMRAMSGSESGSAPLFPLSRWREGYDRVEVDEFVQRLRIGRAGEVSATQVREQQFSSARWAKPGYDMVAVDAYLDAVADRVQAGGSPDAVPVPGPGR